MDDKGNPQMALETPGVCQPEPIAFQDGVAASPLGVVAFLRRGRVAAASPWGDANAFVP